MSDNIEYINKAIEKIENRFLADSLDLISQYIQDTANIETHSVYDNIRNNYIFMLDYMQRGTKDPERDDLYNRLLKETFSVLIDLSVDCYIAEQPAFMDAYNITKNQLKISSAAEIRNNLEDFVSSVDNIKAGFTASDAKWYRINEILNLIYDHNEILNYSLTHLRNRVRQAPIGFNLLPEKFTLLQFMHL